MPQGRGSTAARASFANGRNLGEVGLHQCPSERNGEGVPVRSLRVPSHVPSHPPTAAKVRGFSPIASGFNAETDWLLERPGFELSVPRKRDRFLKFAHQMAARKAYAQQSSAITATTGSSILRGLNREPATMRPDSAGHCTKKLLEIRTTPSSVPARRS
jgi:hypothetical protein